MIWRGVVATGQGNCSKVRPFPDGWYQGSLNLRAVGIELHPLVRHRPPDDWVRVEWMPTMFPIYLPDFKLDAVMGLDHVTRVHEVVARDHLRSRFGLADGDVVNVEVADDLLWAYGHEMG